MSPVDVSTLEEDIASIRARRGADSVRRGNEDVPVYRIPVRSPSIMRITGGGIPLGRITRLWGDPSTGKALALDTPLPTPSGWTTMEAVKKGDLLFDENGSVCCVIATSEVMHDHDVFLVKFDDGTEIVADADHRWLTETRAAMVSARRSTGGGFGGVGNAIYQESQRRNYPEIVTTREISETLRCSDGRANHSVLMGEAIWMPYIPDLPLDPYLLGVWLGDGTRRQGNFTTMDVEIVEAFRCEFTVTQHSYLGSGRAKRYGVIGLAERLKRAQVFDHKHLPGEYLRSSIDQRWSLLCGLMDTDGTVDHRNGSCSFTQSKPEMMHGFRELLSSLGIKSSLGDTKILRVDGKEFYSVTCFFKAPRAPFRLQRKIDLWRAPQRGHTHRRIVDVQPVESVPVKCVAVDSPSHLYLAGETMIPTHNTHLAYLIIAAAQEMRSIRYPDGLETAYWNVEKIWDAEHAANLGVDTERMLLEEVTIIEDIAREMETLMQSCHVHVIDSCSAAVCVDELANEAEDWTRAMDARAWKRAIKRIHARLDKEDNALVLIDHAQRDQQTKQEFAAGGKSLEYRSSMSLHFRRGGWLFYHPDTGNLELSDKIKSDVGEGPGGQKEADGIEVVVRCNKSRVCRPFRMAKMRLDLNTFMFDTTFEYLQAAMFFDYEGGVASRTGRPAIAQKTGAKSAWYQMPDGEKYQGEKAVRKCIEDDPKLAEMILTAMLAGQ